MFYSLSLSLQPKTKVNNKLASICSRVQIDVFKYIGVDKAVKYVRLSLTHVSLCNVQMGSRGGWPGRRARWRERDEKFHLVCSLAQGTVLESTI